MLFTLFWGPGNFYPLMIFVGIHMALAAVLHIVFSEDIIYWRKGHYLKFFHNVMMNSFASIYFHNYLRFDEMPVTKKRAKRPTEAEEGADGEHDTVVVDGGGDGHNLTVLSPSRGTKIEFGGGDANCKGNDGDEDEEVEVEFIDAQRPGTKKGHLLDFY
jgi:hypothetical protein